MVAPASVFDARPAASTFCDVRRRSQRIFLGISGIILRDAVRFLRSDTCAGCRTLGKIVDLLRRFCAILHRMQYDCFSYTSHAVGCVICLVCGKTH